MKSTLCGWIWKIWVVYNSCCRSLQGNHQIDSGPPTATVGLDMKGTWSWKWMEGLKDVTKLICIKNQQQEDQGAVKRMHILHHLHFVKCDLLTAFQGNIHCHILSYMSNSWFESDELVETNTNSCVSTFPSKKTSCTCIYVVMPTKYTEALISSTFPTGGCFQIEPTLFSQVVETFTSASRLPYQDNEKGILGF